MYFLKNIRGSIIQRITILVTIAGVVELIPSSWRGKHYRDAYVPNTGRTGGSGIVIIRHLTN